MVEDTMTIMLWTALFVTGASWNFLGFYLTGMLLLSSFSEPFCVGMLAGDCDHM